MLPGGRFLFWVRTQKPEQTGVYVASLAKPLDRTFLFASDTGALFAPGGDGADYLLWLRGGTLMAQQFDPSTLKLSGDPHPIADPVVGLGTLGVVAASASASGQLVYSSSANVAQFTWIDRTGKTLGTIGEQGGYFYPFRISLDGRRVAVSRERSGGDDIWLLDVDRNSSKGNYIEG